MRFIDGVGYVDIPNENDWYDVSSDEMTLEQARQAVKDLRKKLAEYLYQEPFMNTPCVVNQVCHEDKVKVLDKIRSEIEQIEINGHIRDAECFSAGINAALSVVNKYKVKSEE